MSAKPNISFARWADQPGAEITEPPSGMRDTGFHGGDVAAAGFVNALWFHGYEWDRWLSDGDCAFHNLSATGTLGVTGATSLTGALAANGGIAVPTGQAVTLDGSATLTVGTGAVTCGGLVSANAGIAVPTGQAVTLSGTASLNVAGNASVGGTLGVTGASTLAAITASGLITANAGVTAAANQHFTVSGTGRYKHGTITMQCAPQGFVAFGATAALQYFTDNALLSNQSAIYPLRFAIGYRLSAVRVNILDSSGSRWQLQLVDHTGTPATGTSSAGTAAAQTLTMSSTYDVGSSNAPAIFLSKFAGAGTLSVFWMELDVSLP